jgi:hypothetical protein
MEQQPPSFFTALTVLNVAVPVVADVVVAQDAASLSIEQLLATDSVFAVAQWSASAAVAFVALAVEEQHEPFAEAFVAFVSQSPPANDTATEAPRTRTAAASTLLNVMVLPDV